MLMGRPVMDVHGLIYDVFTLRQPVRWETFGTLRQPMFLTATRRDGTPVVQRLDGMSLDACKAAAVNTARLPWVAHDPGDMAVDLWDGALTEDLPVQTALKLGATQVVALCCHGEDEPAPHVSMVERWVMRPSLRRHMPVLHDLWSARCELRMRDLRAYAPDDRVLLMQLPHVALKTVSDDEKLLLEGLLGGWHYTFTALGLEELPYPAEWHEALRAHGF